MDADLAICFPAAGRNKPGNDLPYQDALAVVCVVAFFDIEVIELFLEQRKREDHIQTDDLDLLDVQFGAFRRDHLYFELFGGNILRYDVTDIQVFMSSFRYLDGIFYIRNYENGIPVYGINDLSLHKCARAYKREEEKELFHRRKVAKMD